jgi:hypothetical protein
MCLNYLVADVYVEALNFIRDSGDDPSMLLLVIALTLLLNVFMSMAIYAILNEALEQGYMGVIYMMLSILAVGIFIKRIETLWGQQELYNRLEN